MRIHSPDELAPLAAAGVPPVAYSPLGETPCLIVGPGGAATAASPVAAWLRTLACPVIAVGAAGRELAAACDLLAADEDEARQLAAAIARTPIAAAVFVRLLRITASMPLADALEAESLAFATLQSGPEFAAWLASRPDRPAADEDAPPVVLSRSGGVLSLTLNRPARRNAISMAMRDALNEALELALADEEIGALRIDGAGACFSAGGDLDEFGTFPDPAQGHLVRALSLPGRRLAALAARTRVRVHGACVGAGLEFPAFAGRIEARADTRFWLPEIGMGLIPGAGGCVSIARRIGRQRLAWLAISGNRIDAATALEWGLVDSIFDQGHST